nr:MAG TPA: hypothetical protein [Crassvirales sp.]
MLTSLDRCFHSVKRLRNGERIVYYGVTIRHSLTIVLSESLLFTNRLTIIC